MPEFVLQTLGRVDLRRVSGGSLHTMLAQPRRLALLAYLLLEGRDGFVRRDTLLTLFWAGSDEGHGRAALRQALQFLRRTLGTDVVRSRGDEEVGIDGSRFEVDALELEAHARAGRPREALALWHGALLDGVILDDAWAFGEWLERQRERVRRTVAEVAIALAEAGDTTVAEKRRAATTLLDVAPLDQHAVARVAASLVAAGDATTAAQVLKDARERIRAELEIEADLPTITSLTAAREGPAFTPPTPREATRADAIPAGVDVHLARPSAPATGRRVAVAALVLAAAGVGSWAILRSRDAAPLAVAGTRVVVMPFENQTGDTALAHLGAMAADWIIEGLSRVDGIAVVPYSVVASTGADSVVARHEPQHVLRLARELGATAMVRGTAYRSGAMLHLQGQTVSLANGALMGPAATVSVPADSVVPAIDELRRAIVARFAPLGDTVTHLRRALPPPTYEAYRDYLSGLELFVHGDPRAALSLFARSAAVDTAYPMPRIAAVIMHLNLGNADSAARIADRLRGVRDRLGPLERATLDMASGIMANDPLRVDAAVSEQARIAPGTIGHYMVAEVARRRGAAREAIRVLGELGPDQGELRGWRPYWRELTSAHHMLGQHEQELAAARESVRRFPGELEMRRHEVRALAALGRRAGLDSVLDAVLVTSEDPAAMDLLHIAANGLLARGDTASAMRLRTRELAWYEARASHPGRTRLERTRHARSLLLNGRADDARTMLRTLRQEASTAYVLGLSGVAAATVGDTLEAIAMDRALAAIDEARTLAARAMAEGDVIRWRAAIAAAGGQSARAADLLRAALAGWGGHVADLATDPWLRPVYAGLRPTPP